MAAPVTVAEKLAGPPEARRSGIDCDNGDTGDIGLAGDAGAGSNARPRRSPSAPAAPPFGDGDFTCATRSVRCRPPLPVARVADNTAPAPAPVPAPAPAPVPVPTRSPELPKLPRARAAAEGCADGDRDEDGREGDLATAGDCGNGAADGGCAHTHGHTVTQTHRHTHTHTRIKTHTRTHKNNEAADTRHSGSYHDEPLGIASVTLSPPHSHTPLRGAAGDGRLSAPHGTSYSPTHQPVTV